jgi:hypothetical protein
VVSFVLAQVLILLSVLNESGDTHRVLFFVLLGVVVATLAVTALARLAPRALCVLCPRRWADACVQAQRSQGKGTSTGTTSSNDSGGSARKVAPAPTSADVEMGSAIPAASLAAAADKYAAGDEEASPQRQQPQQAQTTPLIS